MTNTTTEEHRDAGRGPGRDPERGLPCFVRHPDAGGYCEREGTVLVRGLRFCKAHGEEARIGASMEECADAGYFFERLRNPHVPDVNDMVDRELGTATARIHDASPTDEDHYRALARAYPDTPVHVREIVERWERDERPEHAGVEDFLLDSLGTLNKLMRLAHADGETWLLEKLEREREKMAAQAAYAIRERAGQPA